MINMFLFGSLVAGATTAAVAVASAKTKSGRGSRYVNATGEFETEFDYRFFEG